jgi:hypothetical protein
MNIPVQITLLDLVYPYTSVRTSLKIKVMGKTSVEPTMFKLPIDINLEDIEGISTSTPTNTPVKTLRSLNDLSVF